MKTLPAKTARFLSLAGIICFLCILVTLSLASLGTTALSRIGDNRMNQRVTIVSDPVFLNLALTLAFILFLVVLHLVLERYVSRRLLLIMPLLYTAAAVWFVLAVGLLPRADSYIIMEAAKRFAADDYSPLREAYFHRYSYQLGLCLLMEALCRLFPGLDLNLTMQVINCLLSMITMGNLCALSAQLMGDSRVPRAALLMIFAFLPCLFFNMFVYGVLPMMACYTGAMLCFSLYTQKKKRAYALAYACLLGMAVVLKPNAMVVAIALCICSILYTLSSRDYTLLSCCALSVALCLLLPAAVNKYYELRSGITLLTDSSMQLRLAMGMQDSVIAAGWYNGLIEEYWDLAITPQEEKAAAIQMVLARLGEFSQSPGMARAFVMEKCLTQWSEPSYDILWYASICAKSGRYNGLANMLFRESSPLRAVLENYLNIVQQAVYLLSVVGTLRLARSKPIRIAALILPVTILGGFLYHMIFEAKSQYIYPYMLLLIPLAAHGLSALSMRILRRRK